MSLGQEYLDESAFERYNPVKKKESPHWKRTLAIMKKNKENKNG